MSYNALLDFCEIKMPAKRVYVPCTWCKKPIKNKPIQHENIAYPGLKQFCSKKCHESWCAHIFQEEVNHDVR